MTIPTKTISQKRPNRTLAEIFTASKLAFCRPLGLTKTISNARAATEWRMRGHATSVSSRTPDC